MSRTFFFRNDHRLQKYTQLQAFLRSLMDLAIVFVAKKKTKTNANLGGFPPRNHPKLYPKTCKFKAFWEEIHHNQLCAVNFLDLLKVVGKNDKTYSPNGGEQW